MILVLPPLPSIIEALKWLSIITAHSGMALVTAPCPVWNDSHPRPFWNGSHHRPWPILEWLSSPPIAHSGMALITAHSGMALITAHSGMVLITTHSGGDSVVRVSLLPPSPGISVLASTSWETTRRQTVGKHFALRLPQKRGGLIIRDRDRGGKGAKE